MSRRPPLTIAWLAIALMITAATIGCSGDDAYGGELRDEFLAACAPLGEDPGGECSCTFDRIREEYDEDRYRDQVRPAIQTGADAWPETINGFRVDCLIQNVKGD